MSAAELDVLYVSEIDRIERWRHEELERAGYDSDSALVLAASHEVDLHKAVRLLERGCTVARAAPPTGRRRRVSAPRFGASLVVLAVSAECRGHGTGIACVHPFARVEHHRRRADLHPLLRADAARRDRRGGRDRRDPVDAPW